MTSISLHRTLCRPNDTRAMYQGMQAEIKVYIQCGVRNNKGGGMK